VRLIYHNCRFADLFRGDVRFSVDEFQLPNTPHRSAIIRLCS
jgi:hypothetical protein